MEDKAFPDYRKLVGFAITSAVEGGELKGGWPEDYWVAWPVDDNGNGFDLNLWKDGDQPTITIYFMTRGDTDASFGISLAVDFFDSETSPEKLQAVFLSRIGESEPDLDARLEMFTTWKDGYFAGLQVGNQLAECGHPKRFDAGGSCVVCTGAKQAEQWDWFWSAMGVLSEDITVDDAIKKWRDMEARAGNGLRCPECGTLLEMQDSTWYCPNDPEKCTLAESAQG